MPMFPGGLHGPKTGRCAPCNTNWPGSYEACPRCERPTESMPGDADFDPSEAARIAAAWKKWRTGEYPENPEAELSAAAQRAIETTELELAYAMACRRDGTRAVYS